MPAELHWLSVGVFSTLFSAAWLFVDRRTTVSTLLAAAGWAWMTVTGGSLTRTTMSGTTVELAAGSLQYLTLSLALLSLLALLMHQFGHYPPTETGITNEST